MTELKTRPTRASVTGFIQRQPDEQMRADCRTLVALMREVTGEKPVMWGPGIIGFGSHPIAYANGKEADWPIAAFAPRKKDLVVYLMDVFERRPGLLKKLGIHHHGKVCLYIRRLADVDTKVLKDLVAAGVRYRLEKPRSGVRPISRG